MKGASMLGAALLCAGCVNAGLEADLVAVGVVVEDDDNGDGQLSPGETATLRMVVGNRGEEPTGADARCTVASPNPHLVVLERDDSLSFARCQAGERCDSAIDVQAGPALEPGPVQFLCALTPSEQAGAPEATLVFEMPVVASGAEIGVYQVRVLDDASADGVLNPGETARVEVTLQNTGTANLTRSRCVVGAQTEGVAVQPSDDHLDFYRCDAGTVCGSSEFRVVVEGGPALARFSCELVDAELITWPVTFELPVLPSAAQPQIDLSTVVDDDDRDGQLSVGEGAKLRVALQNVGPSRLTRSECVVIGDAHVEVLSSDERLNYNACDADDECGASDIRVRGLEAGTATLSCPLENSEGATWPLEITLEVR